ncbi:SCO family protein [Rheinheimera sp. NSM]|uniref:SCO family protein n=1 Tax=Rheinheimera sp. NSM TaxID=3457884 RepID=UPI0040375C93
MHKTIIALLLLVLGVVAGALPAFLVPKPNQPATIEWLTTPRSLANFSLNSVQGEFTNQALQGRWTIVWFGFLHCADICPTALMQMATLADALLDDERLANNKVTYVFVSVDPNRDSITEIDEFVSYFNAAFLGVSASETQLAQFAAGLGVQFSVSAEKESYSIAHSVSFSIIDPAGKFRGRFRPGFDAQGVAKELLAAF